MPDFTIRYRNVPLPTLLIQWARAQLYARFGATQGEAALRSMSAVEMIDWARREGL